MDSQTQRRGSESDLITVHDAVQTKCLAAVQEALTVAKSRSPLDPAGYAADLNQSVVTAGKQGLLDVLKWLLENGASSDSQESGNSVLILSAECGQDAVVQLLLSHGCDVDRTDWQGRSALHWAAMNGHTCIVERLLGAGAAVDCADKYYKFTPLMLCSRIGHSEIVALLLDAGADPEKQDSHGETAIFDAVRNKNYNCTNLLLASKVRLDFYDGQMRTPLIACVMWDNHKGTKELILANCDLEMPGKMALYFNRSVKGAASDAICSPLEVAVLECKFNQARLLFTAGSNAALLCKWMSSHWAVVNYIEAEDLDWLNEITSNPRSLKTLCRTRVRCLLGTYIQKKLTRLPLPKAVQDYLYMGAEVEDFMQEN